jgi:hypothetical protein
LALADACCRAVHTDILHFPERVVVTAPGISRRQDARNVVERLSGVSETSMIILMMTSRRPQQRYDHRLRDVVHNTGDLTIATDVGVPRSTACGWLHEAPKVIVSLDVTNLRTAELQQEIVALRRRVRKLTALLRLALACFEARDSPWRTSVCPTDARKSPSYEP